MSLSPRWAFACVFLALPGTALAQTEMDRPAKHVPIKPTTRQELDRLEARRLYGLAVLHERKNRLVEAVRCYEEARRLDPESAEVHRALVPLYVALDRGDDALAACKRTLELDPADYKTGYLYARQLRAQEKRKEAIAVLLKVATAPGLKDRPDQAAQIRFDLGALYEQLGDLAGAEKALRSAVALLDNPAPLVETGRYSKEEVIGQAADTWERIGRICLKAGAADRAIRAFEQAQKKDSLRVPRLAFNLAQVYRDQGKPREALAQLELFLRTLPQGVEGYELKIALLNKLGRSGDIVGGLESASGRDPHNVALRLLLAREYRKARRTADAEKVYIDLLTRNLNADVYRGLFELYKEQGARGAERILDRLNEVLSEAAGDEKKPGNPTAAANARAMMIVLRDDRQLVSLLLPAGIRRLGNPKFVYPTRLLLATLASRTRQLEQAERLYRGCLDRPGGLGPMEAEVYSGLLQVMQLRHKHDAIIELCKDGLAKAQQTNRVLFHRALVHAYLHRDRFKEALAAADLAVNEAGKAQLLSARRTRVYALSEAGKHAEALAECQALLKEYNSGGELRDVRMTLSRVYSAMGKHDESDAQVLLVLERDPNDATANNDLGYHWADRNKNLEKAEQMIRKAIELDRKQRSTGTALNADSDEDNAAFVDSLGWVLFRRGKLDEARKELERASRLPEGEEDPVVWDHLGDVYYRMKEPAKALAAWKKALALYEIGTRRKSDNRHKEIQEKIRTLSR
jgi:tetratricopeptide (TPR) repeat protein